MPPAERWAWRRAEAIREGEAKRSKGARLTGKESAPLSGAVTGGGDPVSILADEATRVVVQGLTGSQGRFHGLRNRAYGTRVVAGVTPSKGGTDVEGIPVFDTVVEAVTETGADASLIFVPAKAAAGAVVEAADAGIRLVVCISEGIPIHDEARVYSYLRRNRPNTRLIGPNCPGVISPGRCNIGITPGEIALPGGPVGVVSRSGTLTYQALHELTRQGIGQTTCVGIGGDPVPGTGFIDCLRLFQDDEETGAVILIGEIGGTEEEAAAEFIAAGMTKPVVAYVAGVTAPPGRRMGHAGAIVSGGAGGASSKIAALRRAGAEVVETPTDIGARMAEVVAGLPPTPAAAGGGPGG
jgi:succinyl-CoA synthetase alpha subunit